MTEPEYPRMVAQYQTATPDESACKSMAAAVDYADQIVLDADFVISQAASGVDIREKLRKGRFTPSISAYVSPADFQPYLSEFTAALRVGFDSSWFVRSVTGRKPIDLYTAADGSKTLLMNLADAGLRDHIVETILSFSALAKLDGIYLDWCCPVGWLNGATNPDGTPRVPGGIDLFRAGSMVPDVVVDQEWRRGWNDVSARLRKHGLRTIGNVGFQAACRYSASGYMLEGFLAGGAANAADWGSWSSVVRSFLEYAGPDSWLQHCSAKSHVAPGSPECLRQHRLTFCTAALLGCGYSLCTTDPYVDVAYIDESGVDGYGVASSDSEDARWLGRMIRPAYSYSAPYGLLSHALTHSTPDSIESTVWVADFTGGSVAVLPGGTIPQPISIPPGYRLIDGSDRTVNNGSGPGTYTLAPKSAVAMFRKR